MGKAAITVDDMSPQIKYQGHWTRSQAASTRTSYFHNTIIGTTVLGNAATFTFNGTSVALYGSKKDDHGTYTVSVDGDAPLSASGKVTTEIFQVELFRKDNLDPTRIHQVVLTNTQGGSWLDLDYIIYETLVGKEKDDFTTTIVDDGAGVSILTPENTGADPAGSTSWQTKHDANRYCYNQTRTATLIKDYTITIPFNGSSVQIFGGISGVHDLYAVSLDGGPQETFNGSTDLNLGYNSRQQIYGASGLEEGPHTVVLTNTGSQWLDVDYAVFNSSRPSETNSIATSGSFAPASGSTSSPVSKIVTAVVSVLAVAAIAIGLFFFVRRRRRLRRDRQCEILNMTAIDEDDEPPTTFAGGSTRGPSLGSFVPTPFVYSQNSTGHEEAALIGRSGQHHQAVPIRQSSDLFSPTPTETDSFARSLSTVSAPSDEPSGLYHGVGFGVDGVVEQTRRSKSGHVASTPPTSVGGERMRVRGREQDAGPFAQPNEEDEDKDEEEPLPPDYHQAIQPYDRR